MAPFAVCVFALLLAAASAQTTQSLAAYPWWCMRTTANESTGEVWAEQWHCRWNQDFHIDAPKASDGTIRTGDGQCLNGGSEGAFFETCDDGAPLQKWEFVPTGATSETLATSDGPNNVPGQIVLASADANTIRPKMCLKGIWFGEEGTRVTTVPCDSWSSDYTTWMYMPPPPANKLLLVMPARHAAGAQACVQITNLGYVQLGDCGDEDLVGNWWVQDGSFIRMAAGGRCLWDAVPYVALAECGQYPEYFYESWSLGEDGSLKFTRYPDEGCMTYTGEGDYQFRIQPCTGHDAQKFKFLSAAPAADADQVV